MTDQQVKELKVYHVACKHSFLFFVRYFFKILYKRKWQQWEHLLIIAKALQDVAEGKVTRLIINVAPRYGKTELAVKLFIAWCLARNSAAKFIHLSYSDDLALDNSEAAKDLVTSAEFQQLFSVKIKNDSQAKKKWYTDQGGGVYATSAGGQITGFGAGSVELEEEEVRDIASMAQFLDTDGNELFGGAIIIDDPNKPDDADSELLRNRVNERYDSTIKNRVNSRRTPIIILQQRTHENDLSGYVQEKQKGEWTVISLPSIKEDGSALCPAKHTVEELRKLELENEVVFQRQHMQNPKPRAGLLFPSTDLHYYDPEDMALQAALSDPDFCYVPADPADEGGDDFACAPFKLIGNKIYVTDMIYNTLGSDHVEKQVVDLVLANRASEVGIEAVMGWVETANRIRDMLHEKNYQNEFRNLRPRKGKHPRIVNRASFIRNHMLFRSDWQDRPEYAKFMRCLTSYKKIQEAGSKNKHDDAPDLCEMAAGFFERNFPELWPVGG